LPKKRTSSFDDAIGVIYPRTRNLTSVLTNLLKMHLKVDLQVKYFRFL